MSREYLPNPDAKDELLSFFENEQFLAFFNFYLPTADGGRTCEGLCKVARPQNLSDGRINYLCLTFVVDAPDRATEAQIEQLLAKLTDKAFRSHIPTVQSITSVPCSERHKENYIHQMDIIFARNATVDVREVIPMILFTIRQATGMKTEKPQWWDEEGAAPKPTAAEKANWGNRIRALFSVLGR